ncbi:MAG: hypothetical protein NTZ94_05295 [Verrucomicrobia bacterium]|nr:hypothetical protein [Verrucomicrobiota bacterium]
MSELAPKNTVRRPKKSSEVSRSTPPRTAGIKDEKRASFDATETIEAIEDQVFDHAPLPDHDLYNSHPTQKEAIISRLKDTRFNIPLALIAIIFLGWLFTPALFDTINTWRANELMGLCDTAVDNGKLKEALALIQKADVLAPNNEFIERKSQLLNAAMGDSAAITELQTLMVNGFANNDELLTLAEQSLKAGKPRMAQAAIDKNADEHSARKISIEMQLITLSGNPAAAVELAKKSLPELSTPDAEKILLATADLLLKSDTKSSQDILIPLSKKTDTTGIEALRLLAIQQISHAKNSAIGPAEIAVKIQAHPLHTSDDALLVADLHILEKPEDKEKIIADLAASRYSAPTPEAIGFARWLNRRMDYQEAIDFIGKDRALSNSEWLLVYLDAHAGLDRWGDVFTLLDADTVVDLSDSIRLLFLARAAKKAGNETEADDLWREMQQNLAFEKPEIAAFVAAYTMRIGEPEQSIKAYRVLARRRDTSLEGYLGITRNWPKNDPAANLLSVYDEFLESFPNLTGQQVERAYLELLAERDTNETAAKALSLLKHSPDSLPAMSAAALGLLKLGEIEKANAIYDAEIIDWQKAKDSWKCVRVATLQAAGKTQEAEKLAARINKSQIRPEELKLLPTPQ